MTEFFSAHPVLRTAASVVIIMAVTAAVIYALRIVLDRVEARLKQQGRRSTGKVSWKMLRKAAVALVLILGIITAINRIPTLARTLTAVLAGSGVLAVVIGFAAQESFGNLISGVFLTLFKPFDVGDRVTLPDRGITGMVEDITLRHTVLRTVADTRELIPNSVMGSAIVENVNYIDGSLTLIPIEVDVAYDTDLELAVRVMREALASHPLCAGEKPPKVLVTGFGGSGVSLRGFLPIRDPALFHQAGSDARILVKKAFDANGITIPYLTVTIANRSDGEGIRIVTNREPKE